MTFTYKSLYKTAAIALEALGLCAVLHVDLKIQTYDEIMTKLYNSVYGPQGNDYGEYLLFFVM
jgi:hypothetical protein